MTFEEWWETADIFDSSITSCEEAWNAAWDQQQRIIDEMHLAFRGHALVPVEPTQKMLDEARNAPTPTVYLDSITAQSNLIIKAQYKAMIQAAQEKE